MKRSLTLAAAALLAAGVGAGTASANHPHYGPNGQQAQYAQRGGAEVIDGWYHRFLGRCAEPDGMRHWTHLLSCNSPEETLALLLSSTEYYGRKGSCPSGFVAGLYQDLVGVNPNPQEVQAWVNRFNGHNWCADPCRATLIREFMRAARTDALAYGGGAPVVSSYNGPAPVQYQAPTVVVSPRPVYAPVVAPPTGGIQLRVRIGR